MKDHGRGDSRGPDADKTSIHEHHELQSSSQSLQPVPRSILAQLATTMYSYKSLVVLLICAFAYYISFGDKDSIASQPGVPTARIKNGTYVGLRS
jgi:hypothetical protein